MDVGRGDEAVEAGSRQLEQRAMRKQRQERLRPLGRAERPERVPPPPARMTRVHRPAILGARGIVPFMSDGTTSPIDAYLEATAKRTVAGAIEVAGLVPRGPRDGHRPGVAERLRAALRGRLAGTGSASQ